jgi:hypothetical protein
METREELMEAEAKRDQPLVSFSFDEDLDEVDEEVIALQSVLKDIARNFYGIETDLLTKVELNVAQTLEECGFLTYNELGEGIGEYICGD